MRTPPTPSLVAEAFGTTLAVIGTVWLGWVALWFLVARAALVTALTET